MTLPQAKEDALVSRVMRPYSQLPPQREWATVNRGPYVSATTDTLAGVLRQYRARMLDLVTLLTEDGAARQSARSQVFDSHDRLLAQMTQWFEFLGLVDKNGVLRPNVAAALLEVDHGP